MSEIVHVDDPDAVERVAARLRQGQIAVVPTDSVYGLAADAFSQMGTQRLFGAKRRGRDLPVPVLIRSPRQTTGLVEELHEPAERLMAAYWPGPLTLVFRAAEGPTWDLGEGKGTVALRMPIHDFVLRLIADVGPLAVTGANRRGEPVPTTVQAVRDQFGGAAALYVDGGPCEGQKSTIVDVTRPEIHVLSEGAVPAADVRAVAAGETNWGARPDPDAPPAGGT